MNIVEPDLSVVNEHTQEIWGCEVKLPSESEKEPFVNWLFKLEQKMKVLGLEEDIFVVLVTGCDTSNGHAFLQGRKAVTRISTSNYPSPKSIEVFVTHEVLHAVHYQNVPAYCFETAEEKNHTGRQLITEGLATYATQTLLEIPESDALWGGYLPTEEIHSLMKRYEKHLSKTVENILRDWNKTDTTYFYAKDVSDVDSYRSGYFLGRLIIERIARQHAYSLQDILKLDRNTLDEQVIDELARI